MSVSSPPLTSLATFEAVARRLAATLPESRAVEGEASLELTTPSTQPARLISATIVEGGELRARRVAGAPVAGFAAFLDGVQKSRVAAYLHGGVPIVYGTVAAVIRDPRGREPMWGLVRVEVAVPEGGVAEVTRRADQVSLWVLAEATPVALPDGRWDKMVYGVRDCEEVLRAIM